MHFKPRAFVIFAICTITLGALVSCALDPYGGEKAAIQIDLSQIAKAESHSMGIDLGDHGDAGTLTLPDAQLTYFDCYAINVVGPGIASTGNGNDNVAERLTRMYNGSSCAYPGVTSPPFRKDGTQHSISLTVPSGEKRIIQVVGIIDPTGLTCSNPNPVGSQNGDAGAHVIVEIARVQTDLFGSKTITPPNDWAGFPNAVKRSKLVDCGGDLVYDPSPLKPEEIPNLTHWHEAHSYTSCAGVGPISSWIPTTPGVLPFTGITGTACQVDKFGPGLHGMQLMGATTGKFSIATGFGVLNGATIITLMKMGTADAATEIFKHSGAGGDVITVNRAATGVYTATLGMGGGAATATLTSPGSDLDRAAIHVVRWGKSEFFGYSIFSDGLPQVNGISSYASPISMDNPIVLGHSVAGAEFFVAESMMFPRNLMPREIRAIVRYLAIKYRLRIKFDGTI